MFGGAAAIDINELPEFFNNEDAKRAKQRFFDARRRFEECKFLIEHDPTEENSRNYDRAAAAYSSARAEIETLYSSIWDMGMHVIHTADGVILEEEAKARKLFREGKLEEANEVIDPDYIFKKCEEKEKKDSAEYRAFISAMVYKALLIKEQKTSMEQKIEESDKCFDKLEKMTALCRYGFEAMIGKVRYLLEFKQDENAALEKGKDVLKKAEGEYYKDCDARGKATLKVLIARAHIALGDGAAAQKEIDDAIGIFEELRETDKSVTEELVQTYVLSAQNHKDSKEEAEEAEALFKAGFLYMNELDDYANAKKYFLRALEIYERLTKENPKYIGDLATMYNQLGILYSDLNQYDKAEEYYKRALEIRERLAKEDPEKYRGELATTYTNLGNLHYYLSQKDKAEEYYKRALEIRERLANENSANNSGELATTYSNLGNLHYYLSQNDKAEEYYKRVLEICETLAKENPTKHNGDLARVYGKLGALYDKLKQYDKAEEYHMRAFEIYEQLAKENSAKHSGSLASTCEELGELYKKIEQKENAAKYKLRAIEIYEGLEKKTPAKYREELAFVYQETGSLYKELEKDDKAEEYWLRALDRFDKLAEVSTRYGSCPALARACLGELYLEHGQNDKAENYLKRAAETMEKVSDENFEELIAIYQMLGILSVEKLNFDEGYDKLYRAYELCKEAGGKQDLIEICLSLAGVCGIKGEIGKAIKFAQEAERLRKELSEKK